MLNPVHQALRVGVPARHQELDVQACAPALWPLGTAARNPSQVCQEGCFVHCCTNIIYKKQGLPGDVVAAGCLTIQAGCLHALEV